MPLAVCISQLGFYWGTSYFIYNLFCFVFQLLLNHQDQIAPDNSDPIHELLEDLGEVPPVDELLGNVNSYVLTVKPAL